MAPLADPSSPATRRVYLFGGVRAEDAGGPLRLPGGRARSLLVYLLLHPAVPHTREGLADAIWPDAEPGRLGRRLADALYRLRQAFGPDWLRAEGATLRLAQASGWWIDVWAFEARRAMGTLEEAREAVALYRGDLAPEIYDDWILPRRVALREAYLADLWRLGEEAAREGRPSRALAYYERLAAADPLGERAQRGRMRALATLGRLDEALALYRQHEQRLAVELAATPTMETTALARRLEAEWEARRGAAALAQTPPFVGRAAERARLLARLDRAHAGNGGLVVLLGEAGLGKTRLLQVVGESAGWRGWQVATGRGEELGPRPPYAPLPAALAAALPPPRAQQMAQLLPRRWLALAARMVPSLPAADDLADDVDPLKAPAQMAHAVGRLLAGLGQIAPHLLILDDVQWADDAFWPLLTALQAACASLPVLILVSGRRDELAALPQALAAVRAWEAAGAAVLDLSPLAPEALRELAAAMGGEALSSAALAHLHAGSGGNPLLALALLQEKLVPQGDARLALGPLLQRRLDRLSTPAQLALQAAAVLGLQFDYALWSRLTPGLAETAMPAVAGELERGRLIELAGDGYRFAHDTLRAHVHAGIPPARRAALHRRALAALEGNNAIDPLALLRHARGAGDRKATARYARRAGEAALHAFAFRAAAAHFSLALETLPAEASQERLHALQGRLRAHDSLGERDAQDDDTAALLALAERAAPGARDSRWLADACYHRADFLWKTGEQDAAQALAERGLAQATGHASRAADLLDLLARISRNRGDFGAARDWLRQALALVRDDGDRFGEARTLDRLANLRHERGEYEAAAAQHAEAAGLFHELGHARHEARALSGLALSTRALGDYERARGLHRRVAAMSEELGDRESQWVELVSLGNIAYELGDFEAAIEQYDDALPIIRALNDPFALALTLYNLGEAHRMLGLLDRARALYDEVMALCRDRGFQRGQGNVLFSLGLVALAEGRPDEAESSLRAAGEIWEALRQEVKSQETRAALALARLAAGDHAGAAREIGAALAGLEEGHRATHRWRWLHHIAFRVRQAEGRDEEALGHLRQAAEAVEAGAARLPAGDRARFRERVPVNREILAAVRALSTVVAVRLARADAPLGRTLAEADTTTVRWTLATPLDATIRRRGERRRIVVRRLLAEAAAQGAAPTDRDLAAALGVAVRTIERDMAALRATGHALPTRRRARGG